MATGLKNNPEGEGKVPVVVENDSTINLRGIENSRRGVEMYKTEVEVGTGATLTLTGEGSWNVGTSHDLGATLGSAWTGTVVWEGTGSTYKTNEDISTLNQAGSWTEVSKLYGHIANGNNALGSGSLWLVGEDAIKISDAYGSQIYVIESLGGSGNIVRTNDGTASQRAANFQICITKDSSNWTGKLKSEGGTATFIVRSDDDIKVGGYFEGNAITLQLEGTGTKTFNNTKNASTVGTLATNAGLLKLDGTTMTVNSTFDMRGGSNKTGDISLVKGAHLTSSVANGMWGRNDNGHQSLISVDSASTFTENSFDIKGLAAGTTANIYLKDGQHHVNDAVSISGAAIEYTGSGETVSSTLTNTSVTHSGTGTLKFTATGNELDTLTIGANTVEFTQSASIKTISFQDSSALVITGADTVITLNEGSDALDWEHAVNLLGKLSGEGKLEYTGTYHSEDTPGGEALKLGTANLSTFGGNFQSLHRAVEFDGTGATNKAVAISGSVQAKEIAVQGGAEVSVAASGSLVSDGTLYIGHGDADGGAGSISVEGTMTAGNGVLFRQEGSELVVKSDGVTISGVKTGDTVSTVGSSDGVTGVIRIQEDKTLKIEDCLISNVSFNGLENATAGGTVEITAGGVLSAGDGCVKSGASTTVPTSMGALLTECSLENTDVIIDASGAIDAYARELGVEGFYGKDITVNLMSGVDIGIGVTLELAGLENYSDIRVYISPAGADVPSVGGFSPYGAAREGEETGGLMPINYTGGKINLSDNYAGQVVDVWVTYNVPEPTTGVLGVLALAGLAARRRRRASDK